MESYKRKALIYERDVLMQEIKNQDFIDPKYVRRIEEISSLLLTNGESKDVNLVGRTLRKSQRVTSFTRDRR